MASVDANKVGAFTCAFPVCAGQVLEQLGTSAPWLVFVLVAINFWQVFYAQQCMAYL
jgi:hypothetical protein